MKPTDLSTQNSGGNPQMRKSRRRGSTGGILLALLSLQATEPFRKGTMYRWIIPAIPGVLVRIVAHQYRCSHRSFFHRLHFLGPLALFCFFCYFFQVLYEEYWQRLCQRVTGLGRVKNAVCVIRLDDSWGIFPVAEFRDGNYFPAIPSSGLYISRGNPG